MDTKVILKYPLLTQDSYFSVPKGAKILTAQIQRGAVVLWAMVNPEAEREQRHFWIAPTGEPFTLDGFTVEWVATVQLEGGDLIYHILEMRRALGPRGTQHTRKDRHDP